MKEKTNMPAVILGITTAVGVIAAVYFGMESYKYKKAAKDSNLKIDPTTGKFVAA